MDRIEARVGKSPHMGEIEHLSIYVNSKRLDEYLADHVNSDYLGLIPAWLDYYDESYKEDMKEKEYVWKQTQLSGGSKVLPILLCPDDFDFSCTVIIVEVIDNSDMVCWNRFGADCTEFIPEEQELPKYIGRKEKWFESLGPFVFEKSKYVDCIKLFNPTF